MKVKHPARCTNCDTNNHGPRRAGASTTAVITESTTVAKTVQNENKLPVRAL